MMHVTGFARAGWALVVPVLMFAAGCRSVETDQMRVLEAKLSHEQREKDQYMLQLQEQRSETIKQQGRAEMAEARALAAERERLAVSKAGTTTASNRPGLDYEGLRRGVGNGGVVERDGSGARIVLASDVTFRAGKADLNGKALESLRRVATAIKETAGSSLIRIEGHTDSDPIKASGWASNEVLSLERARKVRAYLVAQGVSGDHLTVEGLGAKRPVMPNTTKENKAKNRRVEIVLYSGS